jgi:hypothetical protein
VSNLKPFGVCSCGCGREGNYRAKPWADGSLCTRNCDKARCPRCRGRANRSRGDAAGRKARKALGLMGVRSRHEEVWGGPTRTESKAGGIARPVITAHRNAKNQSEVSRPMGDNRPFCGSFTYDGRTVFTVDGDDLESFVGAMAVHFGMFGEAS